MIGKTIGVEISGRRWSLFCNYAHRMDFQAPRPSRAVFVFGWYNGDKGWDFMVQLYRPGFELPWHTDGYHTSNQVWGITLFKSKVGGNLEVEGPCKRFGPFHYFDGGRFKHRVTASVGYRLVAMFQKRKPLPKETKQS